MNSLLQEEGFEIALLLVDYFPHAIEVEATAINCVLPGLALGVVEHKQKINKKANANVIIIIHSILTELLRYQTLVPAEDPEWEGPLACYFRSFR